MTTSEDVLFVRNAEDDVNEDAWNDDVLVSLYDKALLVAKKEVAQRIAMETNTPNVEKSPASVEGQENETSKSSKKNKRKNSKSSQTDWKQGQKCRALYTEDGMEYEAVIKKILTNDLCIVTYVGYGNEEVLPMANLLPSKGKAEIDNQIFHATLDEDMNLNNGYSDDKQNQCSNSTNKKGSKSSGRKNKLGFPAGMLPDIPSFPPNLSTNSPLPPPPPIPFTTSDDDFSEDKTIYPMLVSWYMSGYYTGLYQGRKMQTQ